MASLKEYLDKRRFDQTPEPSGEARAAAAGGNRFVVQKHDARRLHYDFRLEIDGALKSWAVPKGPSLNPADKRLAVMTEDHPVRYLSFEGHILEGNYGAGDMAIWDSGTYAVPEGHDPESDIREGKLPVVFEGKKL